MTKEDDDSDTSKYSKPSSMLNSWNGRWDFAKAQCQVAFVLVIAYIGNNWHDSYPRNDNHDPSMFWAMNAGLLIVSLAMMKREESTRGVQLLSRPQTEEWKGWMQWAFIMYHYYRVYYVYNEIRVFVSAYVWMTGFGNFLYFEKKQDFSVERAVSMWLRINYFPLLLSFFLGVKLSLYYVVPLHTVGFFITMGTCFLAAQFRKIPGFEGYWTANGLAVFVSLLVHIAFYETPIVKVLALADEEYLFRFQADKYSAWVGILSGFFWKKFKEYMQWTYGTEKMNGKQMNAMFLQIFAGAFLIFAWFNFFGYIGDKYTYNPKHPYIFWMPVAGWLMIRNSSKYLTEIHSRALEFFGRITLETYVLQFHVFMCKDVQHIPVLIPGANADGSLWLKTANMLLCGCVFVPLAMLARKATVTTQTTVVELMQVVKGSILDCGKDVELTGKLMEPEKSEETPEPPAKSAEGV